MQHDENVFEKLGQNIKKYRLEKGLSQEKLSELLDVNSKFIGHVERVERNISLTKLVELAEILDVPMNLLFDFTDLEE